MAQDWDQLAASGMCSQREAEFLFELWRAGAGVLVVGLEGSGKTDLACMMVMPDSISLHLGVGLHERPVGLAGKNDVFNGARCQIPAHWPRC